MSDLRIKPLQPKIDTDARGSLQSTDSADASFDGTSSASGESVTQHPLPEEKAPAGGSTLPAGAPPWLVDWLMSKDTIELAPGMMWGSFTSHGGEHVSLQGKPVPYTEKAGFILWHRCPNTESGWEAGSITFDIPEMAQWTSNKWKVLSWDPLTLQPSIQHNKVHSGVVTPDTCPLGHGFITNGKWSNQPGY